MWRQLCPADYDTSVPVLYRAVILYCVSHTGWLTGRHTQRIAQLIIHHCMFHVAYAVNRKACSDYYSTATSMQSKHRVKSDYEGSPERTSVLPMSNETLYAVLGVPEAASVAEIRSAYRAKSLQWHPDKNGGCKRAAERFAGVKDAFEVLSDDAARREYDGRLKMASAFVVHDEVDVGELRVDAHGELSHECRCGGLYRIQRRELQSGLDTIVCDTCSLAVRIVMEEELSGKGAGG